MKYKRIIILFKPLLVWSLVLVVGIELFLHWNINKLPYKFLNHTTGPIRRLGQYSKANVVPTNYIAMLGDSNVYGFGPWLYNNSWSMGQPSFATHHLLHQNLNRDVMAFGYPGYGTFGTCLSMASEMEMLKNSWIWSKVKNPNRILVVFYEGNDLINNLHELEQRGFDISQKITQSSIEKIRKILLKESQKVSKHWSVIDQSACWNLFSGLVGNYINKYMPAKENHANDANVDSLKINTEKLAENNNDVDLDAVATQENTAIINNNDVYIGYCEGPALHLLENEINLSLEIARLSLTHLRQKFSDIKIDLVYLPSSLSIYQFDSSVLRPAPLHILDEYRDTTFDPTEAIQKNMLLRINVLKLANDLGFGFIDTTPAMKEKAKFHLLHGPKDPIHLNRKGYESFSEILINELKLN